MLAVANEDGDERPVRVVRVFFLNFSILLRLHSKMSTYRERTSRSPEISHAPRRGKRQLTEEPCLVTGFPQLPSAGSYLFASLWYDFISRRVRRLRAARLGVRWTAGLSKPPRRTGGQPQSQSCCHDGPGSHRCHPTVTGSHPTGIRSVLDDRDSVKRRTRCLCCHLPLHSTRDSPARSRHRQLGFSFRRFVEPLSPALPEPPAVLAPPQVNQSIEPEPISPALPEPLQPLAPPEPPAPLQPPQVPQVVPVKLACATIDTAAGYRGEPSSAVAVTHSRTPSIVAELDPQWSH